MSAILESYASDDRQHVDYEAISRSEEFRRYGSTNVMFYILFISLYNVNANVFQIFSPINQLYFMI